MSLRDARGAVFVEKLIVYLPLLLVFFVTWELAELGAASLIVQRASAAAGRAAMVVLPDDPVFYSGDSVGSFEGERREDHRRTCTARVISRVSSFSLVSARLSCRFFPRPRTGRTFARPRLK